MVPGKELSWVPAMRCSGCVHRRAVNMSHSLLVTIAAIVRRQIYPYQEHDDHLCLLRLLLHPPRPVIAQ